MFFLKVFEGACCFELLSTLKDYSENLHYMSLWFLMNYVFPLTVVLTSCSYLSKHKKHTKPRCSKPGGFFLIAS